MTWEVDFLAALNWSAMAPCWARWHWAWRITGGPIVTSPLTDPIPRHGNVPALISTPGVRRNLSAYMS